MTKQEIDYRSQFVPEVTEVGSDQEWDRQRQSLVEKLEQGIEISMPSGEKLFFKSRIIQADDRDIIRVEINGVAWISADVVHASPKSAENLRKYYSDFVEPESFRKPTVNVNPELKQKGLISVLSALLFQVLTHMGVEVVRGEIDQTNMASFLARFNTPDFIRGGFFKSKLTRKLKKRLSQGNQYYEVETPLNEETVEEKTSPEDIAKLLN